MYKLIRDKIPEIIERSGKVCNYAVIQNEELYNDLLRKKLVEEVNEYLESGDLEELVDIQLIINTIVSSHEETFNAIYHNKLESNGGFEKRYIGFFDK